MRGLSATVVKIVRETIEIHKRNTKCTKRLDRILCD